MDAPKPDKKTKPELWVHGSQVTLPDGKEGGPRMDRMAHTVAKDGGVPAADGKGRAVWCDYCKIVQPLPKPFDMQNWRVHIGREKHKDAARLRRQLAPPAPAPEAAPEAEPEAEPEYGTGPWLALRMGQWRELHAVKRARRQ
jgi:hypothetical protein